MSVLFGVQNKKKKYLQNKNINKSLKKYALFHISDDYDDDGDSSGSEIDLPFMPPRNTGQRTGSSSSVVSVVSSPLAQISSPPSVDTSALAQSNQSPLDRSPSPEAGPSGAGGAIQTNSPSPFGNISEHSYASSATTQYESFNNAPLPRNPTIRDGNINNPPDGHEEVEWNHPAMQNWHRSLPRGSGG